MKFSSRATIYGAVALTVLAIAVFAVNSGGKSKSNTADKSASAAVKDRRSSRPVLKKSVTVASKGRRYYAAPKTAEWQRNAATLNPEKARAMLEEDRQNEKNLAVRAEKAWLVINQLCQNGFTREAWDLIEQSPGLIREKGLGGFFRDADLPKEELISILNQLKNQERASGLINYWQRFSPEEFAKMDMSQFPLGSENEKGAFRKNMEELLGEVFDPKHPENSKWVRMDLLKLAADQMSAGSMSFDALGGLLSNDPSKDGFTYWQVSQALDPALKADQNSYSGVDANIYRAMAMQDPEKTMSMALEPGTPASKLMHVGFEQWLRSDYQRAEQWYQEHSANFDQFYRDRSTAAFMRANARNGDYQTALSYYEKFEQQSWKDGLSWEISQVRSKLAQQQAK